MTSRSASLAAGLSLAAVFVLALPLAAQAGAHGMGRGVYCPPKPVHTAPVGHPSRPPSMGGYGHTGGGYPVHTGGYGHQASYPSHMVHYPTHVMHYPVHYPNHQGYAYNNGGGYHRDYGQGLGNRAYSSGNSYSLVYAPSYDESQYAGTSGGYASAPPAYADQGYQDQGYQDQDYQDQGYQDQGYQDQGYADTQAYADTRYSDATYQTATYDDAAYAPPPPPQYAPAPVCPCSQPVTAGPSAYGWRDQYGNWHVSSQSSHHYSYSSGY